MAIEIKSAGTPSSGLSRAAAIPIRFFRPKISQQERIFFTERLSLLLETGGTLFTSLQELARQADNELLAGVIRDLIRQVEAGRAFSEALARHPEVFSSTYVSLVRASEQGGFMYRVLRQIKEMEEKAEHLRQILVSALYYPVFLLLFSATVIVFILVAVFPKFGELFLSIRDQLPGSTIFLLWISDILRQYWFFVLPAGVLPVFGGSRWLKSDAGRLRLDRLKLGLPVVKDIFMQAYLVQMLRVMSLSLQNGVSVPEALHACRDTISNALFQRMIIKLERRIGEGASIASSIAEERLLPSMARQMIITGDESGTLALVMQRVAEFYEGELDRRMAAFSKMIEPVMLLVMGVVIGVVIASLILPIFKLSRLVR